MTKTALQISLNHIKCLLVGIPAKPLHNRGIVSVYFNHFHCMGICDKLIYVNLFNIYLNVDEC